MDLILVMKERLRHQSVEVRSLSRLFALSSGLGVLFLLLALFSTPQYSQLTSGRGDIFSSNHEKGSRSNLSGDGSKVDDVAGSIRSVQTSFSTRGSGKFNAAADASNAGQDFVVNTTLVTSTLADDDEEDADAALFDAVPPPPLFSTDIPPTVVPSANEGENEDAADESQGLSNAAASVKRSLLSSTAANREAKAVSAVHSAAPYRAAEQRPEAAAISSPQQQQQLTAGGEFLTAGVMLRFVMLLSVSSALFIYSLSLLVNSRFIHYYYSPTGLARPTSKFQLTTYVGATPDPQAYRGAHIGGSGFRPISSPVPSLSSTSPVVQMVLNSPTASHLFLFPLHKTHFQIPFWALFFALCLSVAKLWPLWVVCTLALLQLVVYVMRARLLWSVVSIATTSR